MWKVKVDSTKVSTLDSVILHFIGRLARLRRNVGRNAGCASIVKVDLTKD
jgi:hypothetical protein